jgi:ribonucleoside-diphosphate reductase alpha chain
MATPSPGLVDDGLSEATGGPSGAAGPAAAQGASEPIARAEQRDAPFCYNCGNHMQRAGSCYVCGSCGTTSGCS